MKADWLKKIKNNTMFRNYVNMKYTLFFNDEPSNLHTAYLQYISTNLLILLL